MYIKYILVGPTSVPNISLVLKMTSERAKMSSLFVTHLALLGKKYYSFCINLNQLQAPLLYNITSGHKEAILIMSLRHSDFLNARGGGYSPI